MPFKKKTAATATAETTDTAASRNEPITFQIDSFAAEISNAVPNDLDVTYDLLPEDLKLSIDALLSKFNVESQGDKAVIFKYKAEKQQLYTPICLAHADGLVVVMGSYRFPIPADADIMSKEYSFNFNSDQGGTLMLDRGGISLEARCFFLRAHNIKESAFAGRMVAVSTAGDLSEYLARGEELRKWSEEPAESTYTIHDINPVPDREDENKTAYALLLAEDSEGNAIRLYAPGDYSDYAGIKMPVQAVRKDYTFTIAGKELPISSGGSYCKLHELEAGKEYQVIGFEGKVNTFGNWQATLQLKDGRKVNGNKAINDRMQGKPDDCISASNPATLVVDNVETKTGKDGKERNYVRARIKLASDSTNNLMAKLQARMAEQQKETVSVGNPL